MILDALVEEERHRRWRVKVAHAAWVEAAAQHDWAKTRRRRASLSEAVALHKAAQTALRREAKRLKKAGAA